jgi:hypothetical protein
MLAIGDGMIEYPIWYPIWFAAAHMTAPAQVFGRRHPRC